MIVKNIFGYPPEKEAREAAEVEKEREEWVDSLQKEQEKKIFEYVSKKVARENFIYPPQKWGDPPREVNSKEEDKSKFDNMPKEEGHKKLVKCETCGEDVKIIENPREILREHMVSPKYECLIIGIKNGDIVLDFENNKCKTALCDKCKKPIKLGKGFETFLEARKELLTFTKGIGDKVVHPSHYQLGELGIEAMDVMRAVMTKEQLKGFYIGNAIKYTLRAEKKNGLEDYKKARYYLDEMIKGEE